jgi:hypothetical protein
VQHLEHFGTFLARLAINNARRWFRLFALASLLLICFEEDFADEGDLNTGIFTLNMGD